MLFSISGPQGSGKSTILEKLKTHTDFTGQPIKVIDRKSARTILKKYGCTLDQVYSDKELMMEFQTDVLKLKVEDEREHFKSSEIVFTERSYADLFAYTCYILGSHNDSSSWLDDYYVACKYFNRKYSHIFYIKGGLFNIENDGVRGINKYYNTMIDKSIEAFNLSMTNQVTEINTPDIEKRVSIIDEHLIIRKLLQL